MATAAASLSEILRSLGDIPRQRVRLDPPPGTATEQDALDVLAHEDITCELIDGTLVEKPMSAYESIIAMWIVRLLGRYLDEHDLGVVLGESGLIRLLPHQLCAADAAFVNYNRIPNPEPEFGRASPWIPNLAVEVLSPGNTRREMQRKLRDYFQAGVDVVWFIEPKLRTAQIHTSLTDCQEVPADGTLRAEAVLPGFELPLGELFRRAKLSPNG